MYIHLCMVAQSCTYHAQAICHIRHLLLTELAQMLACSLILSRIDYCNAVLHGAPICTIQKLQWFRNNAARIVLQASRRSRAKPLLHQLHWLPVQQQNTYKLALLTYKVRSTSTPVYLYDQIMERVCSWTLCTSSAIPLLVQLFTTTDFSRCAFRFSAPSGTRWHKQFWSATLCLFLNLNLKLFFIEHWCDLPSPPSS